MSLTKRLLEDNKEELTQEQFNDYWNQLNEMYENPEETMDYSELSDIMNFEFDLNLSDIDIKIFRSSNKLTEEEDTKLIHKNLGL